MAKRKITQLDLFSGIGGFHLGFEKAGFKVKSYFSEIDKHAIAVYKHQFKDAEYVGSVTDIRGEQLPKIDLITFGSPCQDFSLAGKRAGLAGDRSGLILEAIRLIGECRPSVFIWENVKGSFSSNDGRDFAAILQEFTNIGGYRLEWELLNTSWVLPQNRERVYLVGYSTKPGGDWRGVLPIEAPGRELNKGLSKIAASLQHPGNSGGNYRGMNMVVEADYAYKNLNKTIEKNPNAFKEGEVKALDCYNKNVRDEVPCLTSPEHNTTRMFDGYRIRRLTPIECERLQGFPDNHTAYGIYDGEVKKMSNTQRYKQCGNAVTVDIVALVAEAVKPLFK